MKKWLLLIFLILLVGCSWKGAVVTNRKYYPETIIKNDCDVSNYPTIICKDRVIPESYYLWVDKNGIDNVFQVTKQVYDSCEIEKIYNGVDCQ